MDPITAFQFTAAVVQLVDYSIRAANTVNEIRERGSSRDVADTGYVASHLATLSESLQTSLQLSSIHRVLSTDEKELLDIGKRCEQCSQELQRELEDLKKHDGASRLHLMKVALKTTIKKDKVTKLETRLQGFRKTLETGLLARL